MHDIFGFPIYTGLYIGIYRLTNRNLLYEAFPFECIFLIESIAFGRRVSSRQRLVSNGIAADEALVLRN
jgi:hypothetical protein